MLKRLPLLPTLVVLAAVLVMVRLGFWQIDRMHQKNAAIASYGAAQGNPAPIAFWPATAQDAQEVLFRRAAIECVKGGSDNPKAGRNAAGESGWVHLLSCQLANGQRAEVVLGWSRDTQARVWNGGAVTGVVVPGAGTPARIIADPPLAGLQPNARPDPSEIPNNHWSYAIQWFLFAGVALVIYGLALRKRWSAA
jgi:surfeit locus 1 family protein